MRTLIIGDVHGCLEEFQALLGKVSFVQGQDRLVSLGDLLDRGPDPVGCVKFAREMGALAVKSNHDEKAVRWGAHEVKRKDTGKKNPMKVSPEKVAQYQALSEQDIQWLAALPLSLDLGDGLWAVHAGMEPAFPLSEQSDAVIRVRYVDDGTRGKLGEMVGFSEGSLEQPSDTVYWTEQWKGPESIVYGHAVHSLVDPRVDSFPGGKCYGIDTGSCFGGRLTCMVWIPGQEPEFVQVQAAKEYCAKDKRH